MSTAEPLRSLYPDIEPYRTGRLPVGNGLQRVDRETGARSGTRHGIQAELETRGQLRIDLSTGEIIEYPEQQRPEV